MASQLGRRLEFIDLNGRNVYRVKLFDSDLLIDLLCLKQFHLDLFYILIHLQDVPLMYCSFNFHFNVVLLNLHVHRVHLKVLLDKVDIVLVDRGGCATAPGASPSAGPGAHRLIAGTVRPTLGPPFFNLNLQEFVLPL